MTGEKLTEESEGDEEKKGEKQTKDGRREEEEK